MIIVSKTEEDFAEKVDILEKKINEINSKMEKSFVKLKEITELLKINEDSIEINSKILEENINYLIIAEKQNKDKLKQIKRSTRMVYNKLIKQSRKIDFLLKKIVYKDPEMAFSILENSDKNCDYKEHFNRVKKSITDNVYNIKTQIDINKSTETDSNKSAETDNNNTTEGNDNKFIENNLIKNNPTEVGIS